MTTFIHERMRFFFVHVPKTGGTTVTSFFAQGNNRNWRTEHSMLNERIGIHDGVERIHERLGNEMHNYFSFAFYRNTWDWFFSLYRYITRMPNHPVHERTKGLSFEEFCIQEAAVFFRPQKPLVVLNGRQAVTRLIEFEKFPTAFPEILHSLGYDDLRFKSHNVAEKKDYRAAYTDKTRDLIGSVYADDIAYFDFKF